jgi:hypothetical protein
MEDNKYNKEYNDDYYTNIQDDAGITEEANDTQFQSIRNKITRPRAERPTQRRKRHKSNTQTNGGRRRTRRQKRGGKYKRRK